MTRYLSVSVEETLGKGVNEVDSNEAFDSLVSITEQMNENLNSMFSLMLIHQQIGKVQSVVKSGEGYKAIILYRGDFTDAKRQESQQMIQDVLDGTIKPKKP